MDHTTIIKTPTDRDKQLVLFGLSCIGSEKERFKSKFTKALKKVQTPSIFYAFVIEIYKFLKADSCEPFWGVNLANRALL